MHIYIYVYQLLWGKGEHVCVATQLTQPAKLSELLFECCDLRPFIVVYIATIKATTGESSAGWTESNIAVYELLSAYV